MTLTVADFDTNNIDCKELQRLAKKYKYSLTLQDCVCKTDAPSQISRLPKQKYGFYIGIDCYDSYV